MFEGTSAQAINKTLDCLLERPEVVCFGLGVNDPKGVFETTSGLADKHGDLRVFEPPTSENGFMGMAVGMAAAGLRPIVVHQRVEFALLALDPIVNQAAKWRYMTGGRATCPVVTRLVVGRGWGQGPQHSQSLESWFIHIPGLRVYAPTTPYQYTQCLNEATDSPQPSIIFEHRWTHGVMGSVDIDTNASHSDTRATYFPGPDATLLSYSNGSRDALNLRDVLMREHGISIGVLAFNRLDNITGNEILSQIPSEKPVVIIDQSWEKCGVGSWVASMLVDSSPSIGSKLTVLSPMFTPFASTRGVVDQVYISQEKIASALRNLGLQIPSDVTFKPTRDTPDSSAFGPF